MPILTDPDQLDDGVEITINTTTYKIRLIVAGQLSTDGVTLKAVYSKLKDLWKSSDTYIKHPFPMTPITDEQFELRNGWDWDKTTISDPTNTGYVPNLIRTGGWALYDSSGILQEKWASIITLGSIDGTTTPGENGGNGHTVYYQQALSGNGVVATDAVRPGPVNQAVKIEDSRFSSASATDINVSSNVITATSHTYSNGDPIRYVAGTAAVGGLTNGSIYYVVSSVAGTSFKLANTAGGTEIDITSTGTGTQYWYRSFIGYMKLFIREFGFTYSASSLNDIGVSQMSYQAYRFPLSNSSDLKITNADTVLDPDGNGTANAQPYGNMSITWYAGNAQPRVIGGTTYLFNVIIDANVNVADPYNFTYTNAPTAEQIYEYVQFNLRQSLDVDANVSTTHTGRVTRELLQFIGNDLYTLRDASEGGVFIDNFAASDTNRLYFRDNGANTIQFPYKATGTISFNDNLVGDGAGIYRMFFKNIKDGDFGNDNAVLVYASDNTTNIAGDISTATVAFDFDYDGNTQADWVAATAYAVGDEYRSPETPPKWYVVDTAYTAGGAFGATDTANVTQISGPEVRVVALGLTQGQYVFTDGRIARSTSNSFSLVAPLERNYDPGSV